MSSIYSYLKNVWQILKENTKEDKSFPFLLLLCCTIPLPLAINNTALILFLLSSLFFSSQKFVLKTSLLIPIAFFLLMICSFFWSIDKELTIKAIPKEVSLFLIPLVFTFKKVTKRQLHLIFNGYSYVIVLYSLYFILRAFIRYFIAGDSRVFFYHGDYENDFGLVSKSLNAIHVSVFVAIAYFQILVKEKKVKWDYFSLWLLSLFLVLLSSKNVVLIFLLLNLIYFFFYTKTSNKMRLRNLVIVFIGITCILSFSKIRERFEVEFQSNNKESINSNVISSIPQGVHYVSIYEAWNNDKFTPNDFFPGTSFRIYQARLFFEFLKEEPIFWNGFGLNASYPKIEEKGKTYNVFLGNEENSGYQKKNFHNQYIQTFAELGFIGFLLMISMLFILLFKGMKNKDFSQFAFAILMISLFLTESFLWRQRGVVFFTLFYSLFCVKNSLKIEKK